jgi:hypothetical protein
MKNKILVALFSILFSGSVLAGFTVQWIAPTENNDGSPLLDLAGYDIWCLPAYESDGTTPTTYGDPTPLPPESNSFSQTDPQEGLWKCQLKVFNDEGIRSRSMEIFFMIRDIDGDGEGEIDFEIHEPTKPIFFQITE